MGANHRVAIQVAPTGRSCGRRDLPNPVGAATAAIGISAADRPEALRGQGRSYDGMVLRTVAPMSDHAPYAVDYAV